VAGLIYLDASAIVKLVVEERESPALRAALRNRRAASPARWRSSRFISPPHAADRRHPPNGREPSSPASRSSPSTSPRSKPPPVSASTAFERSTPSTWPLPRSLGEDLESFIAYDQRLLTAAEASGLLTEHPR